MLMSYSFSQSFSPQIPAAWTSTSGAPNFLMHCSKAAEIKNAKLIKSELSVALGNDLITPTQTDNSEEEDDPQLSTEPSCTPPRRGTGNPNANTEQPSGNTQESTVNSCIPVREGSGDPKSEDIPCFRRHYHDNG